MCTYSCSLGNICCSRCNEPHRRRNSYKLFGPDIFANAQWDMLSDFDIFQRNPLIWSTAELVFFCSLKHKAASCTQTNGRRIAMNMPVGDLAERPMAATHLHSFARARQT